MKSSISVLESRMAEAEDRFSELEDDQQKEIKEKQKTKKDIKMALGQIRVVSGELWRNNVRSIGVPEGEGNNLPNMKTVKDVIAKMFLELKNADIQIQAPQRILAKREPNRKTPIHILIRISYIIDKDAILQAARLKN